MDHFAALVDAQAVLQTSPPRARQGSLELLTPEEQESRQHAQAFGHPSSDVCASERGASITATHRETHTIHATMAKTIPTMTMRTSEKGPASSKGW
jgi:hypothetical protein